MTDIAFMERDPFSPPGSNDAKLFVEFVSRPVKDEVASKEANRPVHVKVDYVRIRHIGERDEIFRPAHDGDKQRFKVQWEAFECGETALPNGTPLSIIFPHNPEIIENLKHDKIFTVENLSALNDTQIGNIGLGGRQFVDKAKAFLESSTDERIKALEAALGKKETLR